MLHIRDRWISIMVLYAVGLHLWWVMWIAIDDAGVNATGVHAIFRWIHPPMLLALVVASAALLALVGLFTRSPWIVLLLLPQQILLMMSAAGMAEAIWLGQFADGVVRPRAFIANDQGPSLFGAIGHTVAITVHAVRIVAR